MLRSPIRLYFEITRACQLSCSYCFNASGPGRQFAGELNTSEARLIIERLRADHVPELRVTGGEITQRADVCELIYCAKSLGVSVSVNGNGPCGERTAQRLTDARPNLVILSLDSLENEVHSNLRGRNLTQVLRTIAQLQQAGVKLRINVTVVP